MMNPLFQSHRRASQTVRQTARRSRRWLRHGLSLIAMGCGAAWSQPAAARCPDTLPAGTSWLDREASIRVQEQLPEACLKSLVRQCDADAEAGFMDGGSAATCSVRYEALLRYGFRGNFQELLRWWQTSASLASK